MNDLTDKEMIKMRVFINPGHSPNGIPDPGVVSPFSGLFESTVAANVGNKVAELLEIAGATVKVGQYAELEDISSAANDWNADAFISIHCNGSALHTARGTETFHFCGSHYGNFLALCIHEQIINSIPGIWNRGIKTANFHVLRCTNAPAALVELAFLDNFDDESIIRQYSNDFARAIARGITDFFQ